MTDDNKIDENGDELNDDTLDALEMSDEEFLKMDPSEFEQEAGATDDSDDENQDTTSDNSDQDTGGDDSDQSDDDDSQSEKDDDDQSDTSGTDDTSQDQSDSDDSNDDDSTDASDDTDQAADNRDADTSDTGELTDPQYIEIGKQIMSEFKANGTTMKVKSADDAIQLMQMGANYHKKMAGLKPALKNLKLLENNGLMDQTKLNYLIDLHNKKPDAIAKLLKEANIDPMDVDLGSAEDYKVTDRTVNDNEMLLDEVLDSISETPSYQRTLSVLADEWDDTSRNAISRDPSIIAVVNTHMENGIYDKVANAVAYERSLGNLKGVSDLEAYYQIGSDMDKNGQFTPAAEPNENSSNRQETNQAQNNDNSAENSQKEELRRNKRKAAGPTRSKNKATDTSKENYDPLSMSDEDFAKINQLQL